MTFSAVMPGHKILGGTFQTYYPMLDRLSPAREIWEWTAGSEKEALREMLLLLEKEWRSIEREKTHGSLMLSGIGISHSDVWTDQSSIDTQSPLCA